MTITAPVPDVAALGSTEVLQWLAPAPLWDSGTVGAAASGLTQPFIAEFKTDAFATDFLAMLAGTTGTPADLAALAPETTVDGTPAGAFRLYQPLSQRYYVVTAELVCRRPGIPDHALESGQTAAFVMRRQDASGDEEAFVPDSDGGSWVPAPAGSLVTGEKTYPMHRGAIAPYAADGTTAASLGLAKNGGNGRTLFWGYVPVGIRNKIVRPMADPAKKLADMMATDSTIPDPKLDWLYAKVIGTWKVLANLPDFNNFTAKQPTPGSDSANYASWFLLLDLGDWLKQHLPPVYDSIANGTAPSPGPYANLINEMKGITFTRTEGSTNTHATLFDAVKEMLPFADLLHGQDVAKPTVTWDLTTAASGTSLSDWLDKPNTPSFSGHPHALMTLAQAALNVSPSPATLPPELEGMIREDAGQPATTGKGPTYVIRTVLLHDPCRPILSEATHPFELARALDADAPARKILLQMPDITDMRSFKRGVAIETPPGLQKVLNAVTPNALKGDINPGGVSLGFICSFSLQIIFMVAFIVMFIFLLLFNIVFFWMAFLKICFPIPVPKPAHKGPTP